MFKLFLLDSLNPLNHHRNALPHANAHGAQRVAAPGSMQLVDGGGDQPRTGCAQRVAQRNRAAVGIDARVVVLQAERLFRSEPTRLRNRWTERANSWRNLRPQVTLCHPHVVLGLQVQPESVAPF